MLEQLPHLGTFIYLFSSIYYEELIKLFGRLNCIPIEGQLISSYI